MRGKGGECGVFVGCTRITPAYAGKSAETSPVCRVPRDHPRLCGEKCKPPACASGLVGSPPPMRGKVGASYHISYSIRITPAYAGKSLPCWEQHRLFGDHPRLCGEKPASQNWEHSAQGSPPPMRGKARQDIYEQTKNRITPAYAGKSSGGFRVTLRLGDHPRLCGEKPAVGAVLRHLSGSPPPMRGKGYTTLDKCPEVGITPAYAGKRSSTICTLPSARDHPRLCGEKHSTFVIRSRRLGSPPPMRGKGYTTLDKCPEVGITPAYAGKRSSTICTLPSARDHPRLCGEKHSTFVIRSRRLGSPPPMRGKERSRRAVQRRGGITPAYAGKRWLHWSTGAGD